MPVLYVAIVLPELTGLANFARVCVRHSTSPLSHVSPSAGANTRRRAEVTAVPGVHEPKLSGVGCCQSAILPYLPYRFPNGDEFWMGREPDSFIMHASCYSLLGHFFHPGPVPWARLTEVCRSCPVEGKKYRRSWGPGYNYGVSSRVQSTHPWGEPDKCSDSYMSSHPADPCDIPRWVHDLQRSPLDAGTRARRKKSKRNRGTKRRAKKYPERLTIVGDIVSNCFMKLPQEILECILAYTPTDGVESFARASKGLKMIITPSRLGASFWASRFQPSFECGFFFEAQSLGHGLEWKSLYFRMVKNFSSKWKNRRRIWRLIQSLSELICLQWNGNRGLLPLNTNENELRWKKVHGALQRPKYVLLYQGCLQFYSQRTSIPALLRCLIVSTVSIGKATYITGIRFIANQGSDVLLGYTNGRESCFETTGIHGFMVAVGSRGIHALQFVTPTGQFSRWFGDPSSVPLTRRLAFYKSITALEAGFDVRLSPFI